MRRPAITIGAVCLLAAVIAAAQQSGPTFAVISVKRNTSGSGSIRVGGSPNTFEMTNGNVTNLVLNAYGLQPFRVIDAPDWAASERFDVIAKAETPPTLAQRQAMLKDLLATRFGMVAHLETRPLPAYVLVRQSGRQLGPQLKPWNVDCSALRDSGKGTDGLSAATGAPPCGMRGSPGMLAAGVQR